MALTDDEKLAILADIKNERATLAFHTQSMENHRSLADGFSKEVFDLKAKLAKAERLYGENDRDAQIDADEADRCRVKIEAYLNRLDADE